MTNFNYTRLKEYWKLKINALLAHKGVDVADLSEPNWEERLDEDTLLYRQDINQFAIDVCEDIYDKATVNVSNFPDNITWWVHVNLINDAPNIASDDYWNTFWDYVNDWEKITQFHFWLLDSLKYNPSGDDVDEDNAWRDLKRLLDGNSLQEIINANYDFHNKICQKLGITTIPANWETQLVDRIDFDTVNAEKISLQAKADEYDRIRAKLSGRISDAELDNFLNPPPCSHTDYDDIKNERDTAVAEKITAFSELSTKELSIVERIITDCELGNDTEKTLDQVITRIKELIKDNDIINPAVKNEVIEASKELGLSDNFQQKLSEITTYSSLIDVQKQAFSSKLSESKSEINKYQNRSNWAIGLGSLSFAGLLILTYLFLRKKQQEQENEEDIE